MEPEKPSRVPSLLVTFAVIVILLTPLVVFVLLRANDGGPGMRANPESASTATLPAPPKKNVIPAVESDAPQAKAARKPSPVTTPPSPRTALVAVKKFPNAASVPVGMERIKLIETFGRPNMVTTGVNEGRAVETFHYLKPDTGAETVVMLRSGRVIDATSSAY